VAPGAGRLRGHGPLLFRYLDYEQLRANESNFDPEVYDEPYTS
jgi:hypothetical protein